MGKCLFKVLRFMRSDKVGYFDRFPAVSSFGFGVFVILISPFLLVSKWFAKIGK